MVLRNGLTQPDYVENFAHVAKKEVTFGSLQPFALPAKHLFPTSQNEFASLQIAAADRLCGGCGKRREASVW